jgi:hypothetical protein
VSEVTVDRRGGLQNVVDIVIAPDAAFRRLREAPTWFWAFAVATVLGIVGSLLSIPALQHAVNTGMAAELASSPALAQLPPDRQAAMIHQQVAFMRVFVQLAWLITPVFVLLIGVIQAVVLLIGDKIAHGSGSFGRYFALGETVAVVGIGLSAVVVALIVFLRGADSFQDLRSVQGVMPSAALLVPGANAALRGFLTVLQPFNLWAAALLAFGMSAIGNVSRRAAWTTVIVMLLLNGLWTAFAAARQGG